MEDTPNEQKVAKKKIEIPIWEKATLTIPEAAAYSGICESILRRKIASSNFDFILRNGTKILIKRRLFDKYLESVDAF